MSVKCILTGQTPSVLDGVTENVQTQIDNKQDKITITGILQGDGQGNITAVESIGAEVVTLNKSDVGLGNVDNVQQYSESNPPPYPVTSVNSNRIWGRITFTILLYIVCKRCWRYCNSRKFDRERQPVLHDDRWYH